MLEKTIEKKLTTAVKKAGGIAPKFVSPSFAGQKARHRLLRALGFRVYVIDSVEQIGGMIDELRTS